MDENIDAVKGTFNKLMVNSDMVFQGPNYRITVLTERLIRLEYHPNGIFYDNETQLVQFRNFPKPEFEAKQDNHFLVIKSKYFTLSYTKGKNFDGGKLMPMNNLKVDLNGTSRYWYYHHPEVKNYKGTFVTLDGKEED